MCIKPPKISNKSKLLSNDFGGLFNGSLINVLGKALIIPSSFLLIPILTRNLYAEEYGAWSLIISSIGLILPFSGMGLSSALSRYGPSSGLEELRNAFSTLFTLKVITHLIIAFLLILFRNEFGRVFFGEQATISIYVGIILLFAALEPLYKRIFKIRGRIIHFSLFEIWNNYSVIILAVVFATKGELFTFLKAFIVLKFLNIIILSFLIGKTFKILTVDTTIWKKYKNYGGYAAVISITFWVINSSDRFLLSAFKSLEDVGIYNAVYSIGHIPRTISALITFLLLVSLSKMYDSRQHDKVIKILFKAENLFIAIVIPIILGSALFSKDVVLFFSTERIAQFSSPNLFIITLSHFFLGIATFRSYPFLLKKQQKIPAVIWIIAMLLNIIVNLTLIPILGILGSSLATFLSYFFAFSCIMYFSRSKINYGYSFRLVIILTLSAAIANGVGLGVQKLFDFSIFILILIVGVVYAVLISSSIKQLILSN